MREAPQRLTQPAIRRPRPNRGSALIELTLFIPWLFFLFAGVVDMGFYTYDLIAVENAARVAAEYTSQNSSLQADQADACTLVLNELGMVTHSGSSPCNAAPVIVTAAAATGPDGNPATSVTVTYQSSQLIPIPLLLTGKLNVSRTVQMRVKP